MGALKDLFKTKTKEVSSNDKSFENDENFEQIRITYYQSGYGASSKAQGDPTTLRACLKNLYNSFENQCRKQLTEQKRLKQPYIEEQEKHKTELKKRETALAINEEKKHTIEKEIDVCKFEIVDVKADPAKYGVDADKSPKAQFYIGLILLTFITVYLLVFYVSASYSAFFKDFESDSLTAAIFDANAFKKALSDGWLEAVFVGTIPFVFMGMGYLIHMFQKAKSKLSYFKLGLIIILTFIFDVILAYLIEKKIFDFERVLGEKFSPSIAVESVNFWGIIFAGFVVYIIWGLVFDFIMKEHENIDKIKSFINRKKEEITDLNFRRNTLISSIEDIKHEITSISGNISELQSKIDGFIFPIKEYLHYHYQYKEGWYQSINAELALPKKEKDELRGRCDEVESLHISELKLDTADYQNIVFTK